MYHSKSYPDPDYTENIEGSYKYGRLQNEAFKNTKKYGKIAVAFFYGPFILSFTGVLKGLPDNILFISLGIGFTIFLLGMIIPGWQLKDHFVTCSKCAGQLKRETHESFDFHTCHQCQTFIRGGDFS